MNARRIAAILVWSSSWALAGAAAALRWFAELPAASLPGVFLSAAPATMQASFDEIGITVALVYGPVSALILARRPHPVGVLLAIHAIGSGLAAFGVQWGLLGAQESGLPFWGLLAFAAGWGFVPGTFMTAAVPLLVTSGRVPRWQLGIVVATAVIAAVAWFASLTQQSVPEPVNPLAIDLAGYQDALPVVYTMLSYAAVGISIVTSAVLMLRWAGATGRERTGLAWLTIGHVFLTISYAALVMPDGMEPPDWVVEFGLVAPVVGQVLYPAAILVVVLGQRLWGVELLVSRIILWALLSIGGVAVYLVLVLAVPNLTPGVEGLWIVAPIAIALAVQPMRRWLQRRIDRLVYGDGADPAAVIARLGDRIGELEPGAGGLRDLADALRRVLRLGAVEIRASSERLRVRSGDALGAAVVVPLEAGESHIGQLVVHAPIGERLDRRTLAVIDEVAGLVAAAVALAESNLVLEGARDDLVALRAEERRVLRRELHDGLGPALAGIGFGLAAVENLVASRPADAEALLEELSVDLARRVRGVRALANEVTPSPFDGSSLGEAVGELAARFESHDLAVVSRVDDLGTLPEVVQHAGYFIAAEALTNAVRHAAASRIEVDILVVDGTVVVSVADDGCGLPAGRPPGVGLSSMRERAQLVGGSLELTAPVGGGTVVTAWLPVAPRAGIEDIAP